MRFIGQDLKSSMDRFIVFLKIRMLLLLKNLKSSMDRFIATPQSI